MCERISIHRHKKGLVFAHEPDHGGRQGDIIGLRFCLVRKLTSHENPAQSEASSKGMGLHSFLNRVVLAFALMFFSFHLLQAQNTGPDSLRRTAKTSIHVPPGVKTFKTPVEVKGYCRFLGYARDLSHHHGDSNTPLVLRADDEFNAPNLNVNVTVRPTDESFLALQLLTFDPFSGMDVDDRIFRLSRQGLVLTAGTVKDYGQFKLSYGGTQFVELGDFLMSSAKQVQNSLFDRNAWTYVWPIGVQHENYHSRSDYLREVDFGKRQFNGLRWSAKDLPGQTSVDLVVGRTPFNIVNLPDHIVAGRIAKKHRLQRFELGGMRSRGLDAWTNGESYGMTALSASHKGKLGALSLKTDLAWGRHEISSQGVRQGGFAFQTNLGLPRRWIGFPLNVEVFAVSPKYVNLHSALINTSVNGFSSETSSFSGATVQDGARPFGAVLTPMHLMANNRATVRLTTTLAQGPFRVNLGYLISREFENLSSEVTFYHKVTGLYMSRVDRFQQQAGPNGEITTFFRGAYQRVGVLSEEVSSAPRGYNAFRINAKWRNNSLKNPAFLFYLGEFLSTQEQPALLPKMGGSALVRAHYHEVDGYMPVNEKTALVVYTGLERIVGNENTEEKGLDEQGNPLHLDGLGTALGLGLDISMTKSSSLFLRSKRVRYQDRSDAGLRLKGWEATVEFKIQF